MNDRLICNAFNIECNPSSPFYEESGFSSVDDFDINKYKNVPFTKTDGIFFSIIGVLSIIFGFVWGVDIFFDHIFSLILFGICMPYVFARNIYHGMQPWIRKRRRKNAVKMVLKRRLYRELNLTF
jgi:hypothetical protein